MVGHTYSKGLQDKIHVVREMLLLALYWDTSGHSKNPNIAKPCYGLGLVVTPSTSIETRLIIRFQGWNSDENFTTLPIT